jgi:transposase InsO family protein
MALRRIEGKEVNLIHHSDRGCQYASREYVNVLNERGIRISMTESGDPKDNAQAERINNTMKNELLKDKVFKNIQ